jgi:lipopolysaccharide heptosyltransferase II
VIKPEKILVFRKSSLGDVILTIPVLEVLLEQYPGSEIDFLTRTQFAPVLRHHPSIDELITFDDSVSLAKKALHLRKNRYDLFVDLQSNMQSAFLSTVLGGARRLKYPKRRLARELVVRRPQLKLKVDHTIRAYLSALRPQGIDSSMSPPVVVLPPESRKFADDMIGGFFPGTVNRLVALCPGAKHPEKEWPCFGEVAMDLLDYEDIGVVVIGSEDGGEDIDFAIEHPRLLSVRRLDILKVGALLSRCGASVANDSGLMHLSCAVQTPVVAIFGPTNPRLGFSPVFPGSKVISDDVFCSPCSVHGQKKCSQPEKYCFKDITPKRVVDSLLQII